VSKKNLIVLVVALVVIGLVAVLASACGGTTTTTANPTVTTGGTATTAAAAFTGDPITIGAINSITGVNALTGAEQKWAQEQAAKDYNAKGGIKLADGKTHEIVLKYADDKSSDTEAAAAMEKLIKSEGLKLILSSNTTPYNQAAVTVSEQYGAYYQMNTSWIDQPAADGTGASFIGGLKLKMSADVFEAATQAGNAAVGAIKNMSEPITTLAVMTENNPDGVGFGDGTVAGLKASGYTVASYEKFQEGQKDFSSIILKFKEAKVEGLVVLISPADGITFVKQLKEQGWNPKFMFGFKGFWPVEFMKPLGADSNFICHDGFWSESLPFPGAKELGAAFTASHDGATSVSVGLPYATATILFQAIEAAGSIDPVAVKDKIFGQTFKQTVMGDIVYGGIYPDNPGIARIPLLGLQWIDGQRVIVAPAEYASAKTKTFLPWAGR
jgi:branched-chain amino acid transport system substrate-binding protein